MLEKHDNGGNGELGGQSGEQGGVDHRATNMLETAGNSLQDGDWIVALGVLPWVAVQVGSKRKDDDDESVAGRADEEEEPCAVGITLGELLADNRNCVERGKTEQSESGIASAVGKVLEGIYDNAVGRVTGVETACDTKKTGDLRRGDGDGGASHETGNTKRIQVNIVDHLGVMQ